MFILRILEKIKETKLKILSRKCNSIIKDGKYQEARVKLTNSQLNKNMQQKIRQEQY